MAQKVDKLINDAQYQIFNNLKYSEILKMRVNKAMRIVVQSYFNDDLNGRKLNIAASLIRPFFDMLYAAVVAAESPPNALYTNLNIMKNFRFNLSVDIFRDIIFHLNANIRKSDVDLDDIFTNMDVEILDNRINYLEDIVVRLSNEHRSVVLFMTYLQVDDYAAEQLPPCIEINYFSDNNFSNMRENAPGFVRFINEDLVIEKYFINNISYRKHKLPSSISYQNKHKIIEQWTSPDGRLHSKAHPSIVTYFDDGILAMEEWFLNDTRHRSDGPAVTKWHQYITEEEWYINGTRLKDCKIYN